MSKVAGIFLGIAALHLSLNNTLTLAKFGKISPAEADKLLENVASNIEQAEAHLGISVMPQFDQMFLSLREVAQLMWKPND